MKPFTRSPLLPLCCGLLALAAGCAADPCAGLSGHCIVARIEGDVAGLDQLQFSVGSANNVRTPSTPLSFTLPVNVPLILADPVTTDPQVTVQGLSAGRVVASSGQQIIGKAANSYTFTLISSSGNQVTINPSTIGTFPTVRRGIKAGTLISYVIHNGSRVAVKQMQETLTGEQDAFIRDSSQTCLPAASLPAGHDCILVMGFYPRKNSGDFAQTRTITFDNGQSVSLRLAGSATPGWTNESVAGSQASFRGVTGTGVDDIYIAGSDQSLPYFLHRGSDAVWTSLESPMQPQDTFVGFSQVQNGKFIFATTEKLWQPEDIGWGIAGPGSLSALWTDAHDHVYVGSFGILFIGSPGGSYHSDAGNSVVTVSGTPAGDLVVAVDDDTEPRLLVHKNGGPPQLVPFPTNAPWNFHAVTVPNTDGAYLVGDAGTIIQYYALNDGFDIARTGLTSEHLYAAASAVDDSGAITDIWVVGSLEDRVLHYVPGMGFGFVSGLPGSEVNRAVYITPDRSAVYVAGDNGQVLLYR